MSSTAVSSRMGIGLVVLEKIGREDAASPDIDNDDLLPALERLRAASSSSVNSLDLSRGVKVFDGNRLCIVKPIGRRHWSETAALNDADEIAGSILMQSSGKTA